MDDNKLPNISYTLNSYQQYFGFIQRRFILSVKFILNEGLFYVFKGHAHKW